MKNISSVLALVAVLGVAPLAGISTDAVAQEMPPASVAILEIQKVLRDSSASADIRDQINKQEDIYRQEIATAEQELRAASEELSRQRAIISAEAYAEKEEELKARVTTLQRGVDSRKRELNQARITAFKQVERALSEILSEIAQERGLDLILSSVNAQGVVLYSDGSLNITPEVVSRLNQRLPTVKVPLAQN